MPGIGDGVRRGPLHHVQTEIEPALARGAWIVSDRYVPSSPVLQRLDGLDTSAIWALNETARRPDLTFYLVDDPQSIAARLATRPRRSRLEATATPARELALYADAQRFPAGHRCRGHRRGDPMTTRPR